MLASVVVLIVFSDSVPAPAKPTPTYMPIPADIAPAILKVWISASEVALRSTSPLNDSTSALSIIALTECPVSPMVFRATEPAMEIATPPPWVPRAKAIPTPPASAIIEESSVALKVIAPSALTSAPFWIAAKMLLSIVLIASAPAPDAAKPIVCPTPTVREPPIEKTSIVAVESASRVTVPALLSTVVVLPSIIA